MNIVKAVLLLMMSSSIYAQSIQEQQQIEAQKKQAQAERAAKVTADSKQLREDRESRVRDGGHTVVCQKQTILSKQDLSGFSFYKGELWEYRAIKDGTSADIYFNPMGRYVKKGDTVSWKESRPVDPHGFEVNIKTNEYFYQRLSNKQIFGPKPCEVVKENLQNI